MTRHEQDVRHLYWDEHRPVDHDAVLASCTNEDQRRLIERDMLEARQKIEARRANMSPPRVIRLPEKLELRRQQWNLPDQLFYFPATFDWVGLKQIIPVTGRGTTAGTGLIQKPQQTQDHETATASRGIVITAGLEAMDALVDHGIQLGDIVRFVRVAPWRQDIGEIGREQFELVMIKPGDICACESHYGPIQDGEMILFRNADGKHQYKTRDGQTFTGHAMPRDLGDY